MSRAVAASRALWWVLAGSAALCVVVPASAASPAPAAAAVPAPAGEAPGAPAAGAASIPAPPALPRGEPRAGPPLEDSDFGVRTRRFGLDRQVEMYQWQATADGFRQVWNPARIDSAGFPSDYANPPLPITGDRWWSREATLDGYPIAPGVLQAIGEWRVFRPAFSRLPANLAATFQPEGDGLGSAENPLQPRIGDLRLTWRELHLPPLPGRVELRDGAWQLSPQTEAAAMNAAPLPPAVDVPGDDWAWLRLWPWALGALLGLWLLAAALRGRR